MLKRTLAIAVSSFFVLSSANAAMIGMGTNYWNNGVLRANLTAQGHTVTLYNSYTAATLAGLDVYIQDGNSAFNSALLAQFVFGGGTLIEVPWTFRHNSYGNNIHVMTGGNGFASANTAITKVDPASWLLDGVVMPASSVGGHEVGNSFNAGSTQVLKWADGTALLGYKQYGQGTVVGLNLHVITSDSSPLNATWSNQIIYNAVKGEVPEPGSLALLGLGLAGLAVASRRKA